MCRCVYACVYVVLVTGTPLSRYADQAKQIVCAAVVNEDPNAKVMDVMVTW